MSIFNQQIEFLGSGVITVGDGSLGFRDTNLLGLLPLTEVGEVSLAGSFSAGSILGAINEVKDQVNNVLLPVDARAASGSISPDTSGSYQLGTDEFKWSKVVSTSGVFGTVSNVYLGNSILVEQNLNEASVSIFHSGDTDAFMLQQDANQAGLTINKRGTGAGVGLVVTNSGAGDSVAINANGAGPCLVATKPSTATTSICGQFSQGTPITNVNMIQTADSANVFFQKTSTGGGVNLLCNNAGAGNCIEINQTGGGLCLASNTDQTAQQNCLLTCSSTSFAASVVFGRVARAANSAFSFYLAQSDFNGTGDVEHNMRGDGVMLSDGGTSTPADYAEYFETVHPSGLPFGVAVQLAPGSDKIIRAQNARRIIGITSPRPAIAADAHWSRWKNKYLRDDFGDYVLDPSGHRVINPQWNPQEPYIPRSRRQEWIPVGLLGKLWVRCSTFDVDVGDRVTLDDDGIFMKAPQGAAASGIPVWPVLDRRPWRTNPGFRSVRILII